jgi:C4-dicarboxylate-specific signal transduction histidine kinase
MRMASSSCIELCMPARPTRSLAVGPDAGAVAGVQDAGMDQLFEPLYTTKPDGLGLGLSISRSIIVAHGGRLWATPNARHGATFQFVLPAWKGQRP